MSVSKWIKLNVGGQYFQTTLTTLLSSPDSLLAKMFDPESGLAPAYNEDGVYFLDANPKYFSAILDWLRYKKVMADSDVNLNNLLQAAEFFGLEKLVVALQNKELENTLRKAGAVVIIGDGLGDGGDVCKQRGNYMGYYFKETDTAYRQAASGDESYLYRAPDGVWHVSERMDGEERYLRNTTAKKAKILPYMGWEYKDSKKGQWRDDEGNFKIIDSSKLEFCNSITLSSTQTIETKSSRRSIMESSYESTSVFPETEKKEFKAVYEKFLGKYDRISGDWLNGWPVFKSQEGNYIHVTLGSSCWSVSEFKDCEMESLDIISDFGVTTCPAKNGSWTVDHYEGFKDKFTKKLKVVCDVHGNSS